MMIPSAAYVGVRPITHASVATPLRPVAGIEAPTFSSTEDPEPNVTFAVPGSKQRCANNEAWESPITPQIGTGCGNNPPSVVVPKRAEEARMSASATRGTCHHEHNASSQSSAAKSNNIVRLALV